MKHTVKAVVIIAVSLVCHFMFYTNGYADQIVLADGIAAETAIVDTTGCKVTIKRNEINVVIDKNKIEYIVWGPDTIRYKGFVCPEKPQEARPAVNFKDTPEYKLMALFDNSPVVDRPFKDSSNLAFIAIPLEGFCSADEFVGVISPVFDIFQKKAKVSKLSPAEVFKELDGQGSGVDYVFAARRYHVTRRHAPKGIFSPFFTPESSFFSEHGFSNRLFINSYPEKTVPYTNYPPFGPPNNGPFYSGYQTPKWKITTEAVFMLYDVKTKEIVFKRKMFEKRTVWDDYDIPMAALTLVQLEASWEKRKIERSIDKNAKSIRKKNNKELAKYLGLIK